MVKQMHFAGADGIRGLACSIVVIIHAVAFFFNSTFPSLTGTGKIGVWLFFVLSAFLLTSKFERGGFSFYSLVTYAVGRFLRIIPLFSVVAILYYLLHAGGITTQGDLLDALLLRKGYSHLWTIPVEFKFYAILPVFAFVLIASKRLGGQLVAALTAALLIAAQQWLWPYWNIPENSISTHWYLGSFTIGCYCAVSKDFFSSKITPALATAIGVIVLAVMIVSSPIMRNILFGMPLDAWLMNKFLYLSAFWGLFVIALADGKGAIGNIMQLRFMQKLGHWSFSIYLVHWYFYGAIASSHPNSFLWMAIGLVCAVGVGAILHYAIEAPIERFRHALQKRTARPVLTEA